MSRGGDRGAEGVGRRYRSRREIIRRVVALVIGGALWTALEMKGECSVSYVIRKGCMVAASS